MSIAIAGMLSTPTAPVDTPPLPSPLAMLLQALLFVVLVMSVSRLCRGVARRWPVRVQRLERPALLIFVICLAFVGLAGLAWPLMQSPGSSYIPGNVFSLLILSGALALLCAPLAWRAVWRRRTAGTGMTELKLRASAGRVAAFCALSLACWLASVRIARLHPEQVSPVLGQLQFAFLCCFLLTLMPALAWLRHAWPRRP